MCINYRALNKITIKNRYPMPQIDELFNKLQQTKYFTKLHFKSSYHQVQVKEEDTWKTSFKTWQGLYKWLNIPFGLCNALATFMSLMNDVLRPSIDSIIMYLYGISIFISTWEECISHLKQVLETFRKHELLANLEKCQFVKNTFVYLGHVIRR